MYPRPKTNKPKALSTVQIISRSDVTQDSPGDQTRNLNTGYVGAFRRPKPDGIALILKRCLVYRGVEEFAGVIPDIFHFRANRRTVGMNVEYIHENANFQSVTL